MRRNLEGRKERPLESSISLRYGTKLLALLRVSLLPSTDGSRSDMWCFLGKFAKRKSLKPDLFRRAVSKHRPIEDAAFEVSPPAPSLAKAPADLLQTEKSIQPELAVVIPSPATKRKEVEEDGLRAQEGLSQEDVKKASDGTASVAAEIVNGGVEAERGNVPTEDFPVEVASHSKVIDQELASKATSEGMAQLIQPEAVETSQEPPIDDEEITICLPAEVRTPFTTPTKPTATSHSILDHGAEATPQSSVGEQPAPAESSSFPLSTLGTPGPTALQEDLHDLPESSETLSTRRSTSAKYNLSPIKDAIDKPERASLELVHDDVLETENLGGVSSQQGMADGSEDRDNIKIPQNTFELGNDERSKSTALHVEASKVSLPTGSHIISTDEGDVAAKSAEHGEVDQSVRMAPPVAVSPTEANEPSDVPLRLESKQVEGLPEHAADASESMEVNETIAAIPVKTTRSGARFSDDTDLLKDFLNRAQAKKMAKDITMPASEPPATTPRRSPRKALAELTSNSPSPQKPKDLASRPGTPPGKQRLDAFAFDDVDELSAEPTSCRRSTRTRLPAPTKAPPGAPSFIPVRRADGADPVVLQKSMAQELAVQTRANTRRNKGQSKPPSVALQNLTAETAETMCARMHAHENSKSVGWDERLVYYQDQPDAAGEEGKEEKRPQVRRLRGLGARKGTPAAKRIADVVIPHGTPAPRRRGKLG